MVDATVIDKALLAHKEWKKRLEDAINTGTSNFHPVIVSSDNSCEFGKWLYSLSVDKKHIEYYNKVKKLHADFHKVAGDILQEALSGNKDDAMKKISFGGTYGIASANLCNALYEWKDKL